MSEKLYEAAVEAARAQTEKGIGPFRSKAVLARVQADIRRPKRSGWLLRLSGAGGLCVVVLLLFWLRPTNSVLPVDQVGLVGLGRPEGPVSAAGAVKGLALEVVYRSGAVSLKKDGVQLADDTTELVPGVELALASDAQLDLALGASRVALRGGARLKRGTEGQLVLTDGAGIFELSSGEALRVGDALLFSSGGTFQVRAESGRLVAVRVTAGALNVHRADRVQTLTTGEQIGGGDVDPSLTALLDTSWWKASGHRDDRGYLMVESEPERARVLLDGLTIGWAPLLIRWPAGMHQVEVQVAGSRVPFSQPAKIEVGRVTKIAARHGLATKEPSPVPNAKVDRWAVAGRLLKTLRCKKLDRVVAQLVKDTSRKTVAARAKMLGAECRLRAGQKKDALARFKKVYEGYGETASAEAALFEAAKLMDEQKMRRESFEAFGRYLSSYPQGRFVEAAKMRRCEGLVRLERLREARSCLEEYRARYPKGLRARQAVLLLATIARVERRWADASELYRLFLKRAPLASHAEEARYHLALCLRKGKLNGAQVAVEDYLRQHPKGRYAKEVQRWIK